MDPTIQQQASQSAAQGQQLLANDQAQIAPSQANYSNYSQQANTATQQAQQAANYMQGAGSGMNQYNSELQNLLSQYDPNLQNQLSTANQNLTQQQGALNGVNQQFNQPGGIGFGFSGSAVGNYENGIQNTLQAGANNANTQIANLSNQLGTLMTGAQQGTAQQVATEQGAVTGLNAAAQNYSTLASQALQNMQFYSQLASTQGGLNASEANNYAQAQQGYADAQNALAQIQTYNAQAQTAQISNASGLISNNPNLPPATIASMTGLPVSTVQQLMATKSTPSTTSATLSNGQLNPAVSNQSLGTASNGSSNNYVAGGGTTNTAGFGANTIDMSKVKTTNPIKVEAL